jgi:16S rRNA (cytosine1402-N4)-methyltransferase
MLEEQISYRHVSVLTKEILEFLAPKPGKVYLDATFGGGGHTRALLEHEPACHVIALDWDKNALELNGAKLQEQFPGRLQLIWGNFAHLYTLLKRERIKSVDGIIADLGTSQFQLFHGTGFSFQHDTPLDMRMSPAHQKVTASELINKASEEKLRAIFWQLGEENYAKQIVRLIAQERKKYPIQTTKQLASLIEKAVPTRHHRLHPATKVFQALRIYINHELENIQAFLPASLRVINPGGRLAVISFHSLEDRLVKQFFIDASSQGQVKILTPRPVRPSEEESAKNPSSRSAVLRVVEIVP